MKRQKASGWEKVFSLASFVLIAYGYLTLNISVFWDQYSPRLFSSGVLSLRYGVVAGILALTPRISLWYTRVYRPRYLKSYYKATELEAAKNKRETYLLLNNIRLWSKFYYIEALKYVHTCLFYLGVKLRSSLLSDWEFALRDYIAILYIQLSAVHMIDRHFLDIKLKPTHVAPDLFIFEAATPAGLTPDKALKLLHKRVGQHKFMRAFPLSMYTLEDGRLRLVIPRVSS